VELRIILWQKELDIDHRVSQIFDEYPNFKIRYITDEPPITSSIFDNNEAFISTSSSGDPVECPGLWSNTPSFVKLIKNDFNTYWVRAHVVEHKSL
jgi:hypothetical protein